MVGGVITAGLGVDYASDKFFIIVMNVSLEVINRHRGYPLVNHPMLLTATFDGSYVTSDLTIGMLKESWRSLLRLSFLVAHG